MNILCSVGLPEEILNKSNEISLNIDYEDYIVIPVFNNQKSKDDFER